MATTFPGLVNIETSTITIATLNNYNETDSNVYVDDLSSQIDTVTAKKEFNLAEYVKPNTLILTLDGLTLSPLSGGLGDYKIVQGTTGNPDKIEILWDVGIKADAGDTVVLLARYTIK